MHPVPQPADFDAATPGAWEISFLAGVLVITAFGAIGLTASLLFGAYGLVAFVIAHAVVSRMVSANLVWQSGVSGRTAGVFWLYAAVLAWPLSNIAVMVSPSELSALIHLGGADGTTDARSLPSVWHLLDGNPAYRTEPTWNHQSRTHALSRTLAYIIVPIALATTIFRTEASDTPYWNTVTEDSFRSRCLTGAGTLLLVEIMCTMVVFADLQTVKGQIGAGIIPFGLLTTGAIVSERMQVSL